MIRFDALGGMRPNQRAVVEAPVRHRSTEEARKPEGLEANEKATPAKGRPLLSRENSSNGRQNPPKLSGRILWAEKGGCQGNFR